MIRTPHFNLRTIFVVPAVVAVLSLFGLVAALIGDGLWDAAGWLTLGVSIGVLIWALIARRHR